MPHQLGRKQERVNPYLGVLLLKLGRAARPVGKQGPGPSGEAVNDGHPRLEPSHRG